MQITLLIAFFIFFVYNSFVISDFGIPKSLSETYYLYKERYNRGWFFPVSMFVIIGLLLPLWIVISEGSIFQFLAFLAPVSLLFVATAPMFKSSNLENNVHTISAYIGAACALLWIILVAQYWWIIIATLISVTLVALKTDTFKSGIVYWLELVTLVSTFITMFLYM